MKSHVVKLLYGVCVVSFQIVDQIKSNQIKIYIAPYVHEDSEALGGWITCSRRI